MEMGDEFPYEPLDGFPPYGGGDGNQATQAESDDISNEGPQVDENEVKKIFSLYGTIAFLGWMFCLLAKLQLLSTLNLQLGVLAAGATSGIFLALVSKETPVPRCEIFGSFFFLEHS